MKPGPVISILLLLVTASCARDLGNYVYSDLGGPAIGGIDDAYSCLTQETLTISPEVTGGLSQESYGYEWMVIDNNNDDLTVIGNGKDLDYQVTIPPGSYSLYFTMTEKERGIMWRASSTLNVSTSMSEGWMVLCSDGGRTRLDFISEVTSRTYPDVLATRGELPQMDGPRRLQWLPTLTDGASPYYLMTDDGATRLGKDDFSWREQYRIRYESAQLLDLKPFSIGCSGFGKVLVSGDGTDNSAYYCEIMGISGLYGSKINKDFNIAPAVGANVLATSVYAAVYLLYDTDSGKFMGYCPLLSRPDLGGYDALQEMDSLGEIAETQNGAKEGCDGVVEFADGFAGYPLGMGFVYMENTRYDPGNASMGVTYTILSDGDSRLVYGIQCGDMLTYSDCTYVIGKAVFADISSCTLITDPSNLYAFSSLRNCLYYSNGGSLYRADLSASPVTSQLQFSLPGERITCLKFNLYEDRSRTLDSHDLIVASVTSSGEGIIRIYEGYDCAGDFREAEPTATYRGAPDNPFPEIIDVTYKELTY